MRPVRTWAISLPVTYSFLPGKEPFPIKNKGQHAGLAQHYPKQIFLMFENAGFKPALFRVGPVVRVLSRSRSCALSVVKRFSTLDFGRSAKEYCLQATGRRGAISAACNNLRNNAPGLPQYS